MTIIVGIDVAKFKHDIYAIKILLVKLLSLILTIKNNLNGFNKLLDKLNSFNPEDVLIGMEETGHYHQNLATFFHGKGFDVGLINQLQTNRLRQTDDVKPKLMKLTVKLLFKL